MTNPNARSFTASVCALTVRLYHRGADWNWPQVEELYKITSIDKWFLYKLKRIVDVDNLIEVRSSTHVPVGSTKLNPFAQVSASC